MMTAEQIAAARRFVDSERGKSGHVCGTAIELFDELLNDIERYKRATDEFLAQKVHLTEHLREVGIDGANFYENIAEAISEIERLQHIVNSPAKSPVTTMR